MDIAYDILKVSEDGAYKTHIVYRSNLNSKLMAKYLRALIESGMLRIQEGEDGPSVYRTTEKGILFVRSYESIRTVFDPDSKMLLAIKHEK